jgi:hypothetical protein
MADMTDPAGSLGRVFIKGYIDLVDGATIITIIIPSQNDVSYVPYIAPNWNTSWAITTLSRGTFTATFQTPAPSGARVRWIIFR